MFEEQFPQRSLPSRTELHKILITYFNESELRDLCFRLDIDYEELPGSTKSDKARELITYAERNGRYEELVRLVQPSRIPHNV